MRAARSSTLKRMAPRDTASRPDVRASVRTRGSSKAPPAGLPLITPAVADGMRIGLMGGSFNPPHTGHIAVARAALRRLGLDRVWLLVTPGNPLKSKHDLGEMPDRLAAVQRIAAHDPRIIATDIERRLGSAYTVDTLAALRRRHPGVRFVWIMGADSLANFHRWREWRRIASLAPMAIVDRPGWRFRALASPAARTLAGGRIREHEARLLTRHRPPAWAFLSTRLSPLSSTDLRRKRAAVAGA